MGGGGGGGGGASRKRERELSFRVSSVQVGSSIFRVFFCVLLEFHPMRAFSTRAGSPLVSATTTAGSMSVSRGTSSRSSKSIGAGAVAAGGEEAALPIRRQWRRALTTTPTALPIPRRQNSSSRRGPAPPAAALTERGTRVDASGITIKRSLGEGSYGQVFEVRTFFFSSFEIRTKGGSPLLFPSTSTSPPPTQNNNNKNKNRERSPRPRAPRASSSSA